MKVIIINDMDGHTNAFRWCAFNACALLEGCLAAEKYNTRLHPADVKAFEELAAGYDAQMWSISQQNMWCDMVEEAVTRAYGDRNSPIVIKSVPLNLTVGMVEGALS